MNQKYSPVPVDEPADEDAGRPERAERDPFLTAMGERVRLLRAPRHDAQDAGD
jgi:XRE family aerobic/anaerobic benzoate catabolism transcriptional regulator